MFKNTASQKLIVFAFDATTNLPKTGDAANLTAYVSKDYGAVTVLGDTSATEMDATNAKGYYLFDLTQAETNADVELFSAKSSTANIVVIGVPARVLTSCLPNVAAGASGGVTIAGSNAATTFASLTCTGAFTISDGIVVTCSTTDKSAFSCTGNGIGNGGVFKSGGGATGDGLRLESNSASGYGLQGIGTGSNNAAIKLTPTGTGEAILASGKITVSGAVAFQSTFAVTTSTALGALSCTTLTASGAVAFQSTFAVTTSTSLAALSCTTLTASGAVAFQSTFAVTTSTNLAALSCSTFSASGLVQFNSFTCNTNFLVAGTTSFTGNVAMAAGVTITQSTANTAGLTITGNGSGAGIKSTGGAAVTTTAAGPGISFVGGAASTSAGGVAGFGVLITGGAGAASTNGAEGGLKSIGGGTNTVASNAHGFTITGTSTGDGINATSGGGATGNGITATAASTNGSGMKYVSTGTGSGILTDKITASGAVAFQSTFAVTTSTALAALSCTTLTASGAVAFQSTFAVTTSTSLAALSCTTLTASGAVAFQSTFAVTTSSSLGALSASTVTFSGAVAFQSTFIITGATTFTGAITGTNASNNLRINGIAPGGAGGLFIAGSNAATTVASLTCTGQFLINDGMSITCSTTNRTAFSAVGDGSGMGINATGGDGAGSIGIRARSADSIGTGIGFQCTAHANGGIAMQLASPGPTTSLQIDGPVVVAETIDVAGATTFAGVSTGALACTTFTASGAVAFQSTFAVTGASTFTGTVTFLGDFKIDSNFYVTGVTTFTGVFTASAGFVNAYPVGAYYPSNVIDSGTAQSATGTTLVLRAAAAFANSELIGATVVIRSATAGAGQRRLITANVGATDTVTVDTWTTTPTGTILYDIIGTAPVAASAGGDPWATALPGAYGAGTAGFIVGTNLNATITSRMATYTQPTGFLAATFPSGTIANTTNITAGTITTTTNLTNLPSIPANWITAAGTAADFGTEIAAAVWQDTVAGDFTVASSIGKSLYTAGVVPGAAGGILIAGSNAATTFAGLTTGALSCTTITTSGLVTFNALTVTGAMTVGTNSIPWNAAWNASVQSDCAAAISADAVDGLTHASYQETLLAAVSGVSTVSGSTQSFKKRDGTTEKLAVTVGTTPGERTVSTIT